METNKFTPNIPNLLSLYRLISFPAILFFVLTGKQYVFIILLSINLITDILDGFIARRFNMKTEFGARLDSWADMGTLILAFAGLIKFQFDFMILHKLGLGFYVFLYILSLAITLLKFGRLCGLHLYSYKITGYLQGIFIVILFGYGNIEWFYWLMIIVGCWANIEEIVIFLLLKEPKSNVKGLYWLLKQK
jgi:cardiolipin synthase